MERAYYIGGGTCCGKSTLAELLCRRHGLAYYKLDDDLDRFLGEIARAGNSLADRTQGYTMEQMWMRSPETMCQEELRLYEDMYPRAQEALRAFSAQTALLAEGAGFLPRLIHRDGVAQNRYLCMVPTREFQLEHYARRPWIRHYLAGTSDPDRAFANWMERDVLFSARVLEEAQALGYPTLVVDGSRSVEDTQALVEGIFGLR